MDFSKLGFEQISTMISIIIATVLLFANSIQSTKLPDDSRIKAGLCLREFLGYDIYKNVLLSDEIETAAYLEFFCEQDQQETKSDQHQEKRKSQDSVEVLKKCLDPNPTIFDRYHKIGNEKLTQINTDLQTDLSFTDFDKFAYGLCNSEEEIDFNELEDQHEAETTIKCLENYLGQFLYQIEKILSGVKQRVEEFIQHYKTEFEEKKQQLEKARLQQPEKFNKPEVVNAEKHLDTGYQSIINDLNDLKISNDADQFIKTCKNNHASTPEEIGYIAQKWIENYRTMYQVLDHYEVTNDPIMDTEKDEISSNNTVDQKIWSIYHSYKSCAKWNCAMKPGKSIPLYDKISDFAAENKVEYNFYRVFAQLPKIRAEAPLMMGTQDSSSSNNADPK